MPQVDRMTLAEAKAYAKECQSRLKLNHWDLRVRFGKPAEMTSSDGSVCDGFIHWQSEYRIANMVISREQTRRNMQETIMHETVHLLLEGHQSVPSVYSPAYEFGLNVLSELLAA